MRQAFENEDIPVWEIAEARVINVDLSNFPLSVVILASVSKNNREVFGEIRIDTLDPSVSLHLGPLHSIITTPQIQLHLHRRCFCDLSWRKNSHNNALYHAINWREVKILKFCEMFKVRPLRSTQYQECSSTCVSSLITGIIDESLSKIILEVLAGVSGRVDDLDTQRILVEKLMNGTLSIRALPFTDIAMNNILIAARGWTRDVIMESCKQLFR